MGSLGSSVGRICALAVLLVGVGCTQRAAPVNVVGAQLPPRAVERVPQRVYRPAPPPVYRVPEIATRAPDGFERPINRDLPPPNIDPVVRDVGTPSGGPRRKPVQPRRDLELDDNPYASFDPSRRDEPRIDEESLPDLAGTGDEDEAQLRASDDYATLLGEEDGEAGSGGAIPPAGSAPPAGKTLVALLVPETDRRGSVRALADGLAKAASLAARDLGQESLELRKYDTGGNPAKAAEAARQAVSDGARMIIGPLFSGSASAVRPVASQAGIDVISFTTDRSVLGDGIYSIAFLPETDVDRIVSYAAAQDRRRIALLVPDSPFGGLIAGAARKAASRSGAEIVQIQPFKDDFRSLDAAATDFATFYKGAPDTDAVIIATSGRNLQGLAAYLAYRDVLPTKVKYLGLGLWDDPETFREATLRNGWFPGIDPSLKSDFSYRYGQAYDSDPPAIALLGYDAVAVAAQLAARDRLSRGALTSAEGFEGMSGKFRFLRDGSNARGLSILAVGKDSFIVVEPAPAPGLQVSSLVGG